MLPRVTEALISGLLAGYGVAVPVGAIGVLILSLSARTRLLVGAGAGLGVATADGLYAAALDLVGRRPAELAKYGTGAYEQTLLTFTDSTCPRRSTPAPRSPPPRKWSPLAVTNAS